MNIRSPEIVSRASQHGDAIALHADGKIFSYSWLLNYSKQLAQTLLQQLHCSDLRESRVINLAPAGADYVVMQWAIWLAGGIAVPLALDSPETEIAELVADCDPAIALSSRSCADRLQSFCQMKRIPLLVVRDGEVCSKLPVSGLLQELGLPDIQPQRRAMIVYTSGTTGKPKGVVLSHHNIESQIKTLVDAWQWQPDDFIPLFLPLHHIHGIINVLCCALWVGAEIEAYPRLEVKTLTSRIKTASFSLFMAVPTVYIRLLSYIRSLPADDRVQLVAKFQAMRLMISGSAALPVSIHQQWRALTGHDLLERYGMSETGMTLSNPLQGERRAGTVGLPLAGVDIRLLSERGEVVTAENEPGEILVKSESVFREYWNRPEVTASSFSDSWFRTGDMAVIEDGYYRILGRISVDIIKRCGYKISALEIESVLLEHEAISECAVVGVADFEKGENIVAAVVVHRGATPDEVELRHWCRTYIAGYKVPDRFLMLDSLPRNAMGKVQKKRIQGF
ncbi:acyl-CoA synthetase [Endozoicomonadaceae bacterium StTr2]